MTHPPVEGNESKDIPASVFADDDGRADARLAQALIRFQSGRASLAVVVEALAYARVLVPVLASGDVRHVGKHGLAQDAVASTGVVALEAPDGRRALPIFTDVEAMKAWNPDARPVPAEAPRAALASVAEEWSTMVINPGIESTVIPRPAVWALAQGEPWRPAVTDGTVDPEIVIAVREAVAGESAIREVAVVAGLGAEVAIIIAVAPGLASQELADLLEGVQASIARTALVAQRVDSLELKVESA